MTRIDTQSLAREHSSRTRGMNADSVQAMQECAIRPEGPTIDALDALLNTFPCVGMGSAHFRMIAEMSPIVYKRGTSDKEQ
jgi:hypothetical protein